MKLIGLFIAGIIILILGSMGLVGFFVYETVVISPQFNTAVHDHTQNAYYSSDPVTMRSELKASVQGMWDLGLTERMYSTIWPWEQTPKNQMAWQYKHMGSILTRVDEWEKWETTNAGSQQMQDVNTQKLDNVRKFIKEDGWSDDIAEGAFLVNNYLFVVLGSLLSLALFIGGLIFVMASIFGDLIFLIFRTRSTVGNAAF